MKTIVVLAASWGSGTCREKAQAKGSNHDKMGNGGSHGHFGVSHGGDDLSRWM